MGFRQVDVVGTTRYDLPTIAPDAWVEFRNELTVGEKRKLQNSSMRLEAAVEEGSKAKVAYDPSGLTFARVKAYLKDWSRRHDPADGAPVSLSALEAMDADEFAVVEEALERHVVAKKSERTTTATTGAGTTMTSLPTDSPNSSASPIS